MSFFSGFQRFKIIDFFYYCAEVEKEIIDNIFCLSNKL